ncbi:MAG: hypothetical protein ACTSPY_02450 [Candidatus Helarchaeota archaeon]
MSQNLKLLEIEELINNNNNSFYDRIIGLKKLLDTIKLGWLNLRITINWDTYFQPFLIKTPFRINSNYCMERFLVDGKDGEFNFCLFYVPKEKIQTFENRINRIKKTTIYKLNVITQQKISIKYLQEMDDPDHYISEEILVLKYLYRENFPIPIYNIDLKNALEEKKPKMDFTQFLLEENRHILNLISRIENKYLIHNTKLLEYIFQIKNKNVNINNLFQIAPELPSLDHTFIEVSSNDMNYLNSLANIPFPYSRIFYSKDFDTLFINAAVIGKYYTAIESIEDGLNIKNYIILRNFKYNNSLRIVNFDNNKYKKVRVRIRRNY